MKKPYPKYQIGDIVEFKRSGNRIQITVITGESYIFNYFKIVDRMMVGDIRCVNFRELEKETQRIKIDAAKIWRETLNEV